jgi:hypothetical protein
MVSRLAIRKRSKNAHFMGGELDGMPDFICGIEKNRKNTKKIIYKKI